MFGFFRTFLALLVVVHHLKEIPVFGGYAVFAFFILSGFLMTTIKHESYGFDKSGIKRYAINRFLRLYPMYWGVLALSIAIVLYVDPYFASSFKKGLTLPDNFHDSLFNFTSIFPALIPYQVQPRLSPPAWALTIEIFYYVLIGLGLSKSKRVTIIWLALSALYYFATYVAGVDSVHRYATIFAGSLPFAIGAALYFYKSKIHGLLEKSFMASPYVLFTLYLLNTLTFAYLKMTFNFDPYYLDIGKYLNMILTASIIVQLYYGGADIFSRKVDKVLGDFSYPVYLLHWQIGLLMTYVLVQLNVDIVQHSWLVLTAIILMTLLASYLLTILIDERIAKVRRKIKKA